MLHDFSFTPPEEIYAGLKKRGSMAEHGEGGARDARHRRHDRWRHGRRRQPTGPDLNDVNYDAFLANDRTLADPEVVRVEPGGQVLLRVINGSSMSNFHVELGQLDGELIAVDGFEIAPIAAPLSDRGRAAARHPPQRFPGTAAYPVLAMLEGERAPDRHRAGRRPRRSRAHPRRGGNAVTASDARSRTAPARARTAWPAQGGPRPHAEPDRRNGRLRLVDQRRRLEHGRPAAAGRQGRTGGACLRQQDPDAASDASARPRLPGRRDRRRAILRARCATPSWCRPDGASSSLSTPTIPGWWAFHCHLLYHLEAGMFTTIKYM